MVDIPAPEPYDVPATINGWSLVENKHDRIVWEREELRDGVLNRLRALIGKGHRQHVELEVMDGKHGWRVRKHVGPYTMHVVSSTQLSPAIDKETERNRAFWHAKQTLLDRELTPVERGRVAYTGTVDGNLIDQLEAGQQDNDAILEQLHDKYEATQDNVKDVDAFFGAPKNERKNPF